MSPGKVQEEWRTGLSQYESKREMCKDVSRHHTPHSCYEAAREDNGREAMKESGAGIG